jgi:hypothetical protein
MIITSELIQVARGHHGLMPYYNLPDIIFRVGFSAQCSLTSEVYRYLIPASLAVLSRVEGTKTEIRQKLPVDLFVSVSVHRLFPHAGPKPISIAHCCG